jgi:hypothetical protein
MSGQLRSEKAVKPHTRQGIHRLTLRLCACVGLLPACGGAPMQTTVELPDGPRQPDGVAFDPPSAIPRAVEAAGAGGVVTLKEPIGDRAIRSAISGFFAAFAVHDPEALDAILSHSARLLYSHGASSYVIVRDELLRRLAGFSRAGVNSVPIDSIERFDYGDLGASAAHPRPPEMRKGDILVRVHLSLPKGGTDRLFADIVVLLFRWEEDVDGPGSARLRVAGFDEEEPR